MGAKGQETQQTECSHTAAQRQEGSSKCMLTAATSTKTALSNSAKHACWRSSPELGSCPCLPFTIPASTATLGAPAKQLLAIAALPLSRRQCGAVEGEEGARRPDGAGARDLNCTHPTRQSLPQVKMSYTDIKFNNKPLPGRQRLGCRCASPPLPLLHRLPCMPGGPVRQA